MASRLRHRGPDDVGSWADPTLGTALGHTRLAIIDLSSCGHQPMVSATGNLVIAYNGEIYNHPELRAELMTHGVTFRGHSDTEVLLAAIERWGVVPAAARLVGMFAFAVVDRRARLLHLVRDRVGEKPLYYGLCKGSVVFGSELKALQAHPSWEGEIDRQSLALYLAHNYVPAPRSIFRNVWKVPPGTIVTFELDDGPAHPSETSYWSATRVALTERAAPVEWSEGDLVAELHRRLTETVERELLADVDLGAFLSGGIDSSLIVALMQEGSRRPVRSFTIGFEEDKYNEAEYARAVARHLGTKHTELYISAEEARRVIPLLPKLYDEPFADSSQIPTYLVARLASEHVKVCLTGDGGDELFGGYGRYFAAARAWSLVESVPGWSRAPIRVLLNSMSVSTWDKVLRWLPRTSGSLEPTGHRVHRLAELLQCSTIQALYHLLITYWPEPGAVVIGAEAWCESSGTNGELWPADLEDVEGMMLADFQAYLPDDILVKVDRASMGASLESRAPFLDHGLVQFAWRIPLERKVGQGRGKHVLRRLLHRYVPEELVDRPKAGFGVPVAEWLRGPLRAWAETKLDAARLRREGYLRPEPILKCWKEHLEGRRNWEYRLWGILMFELWLETQ